jgi:Holliday junction resolvase RusA-like endonuclease
VNALEFFVDGLPVPQGSKSAWVNKRTGRAVIHDDTAKSLKPWRAVVRDLAADAWGDREPLDEPVVLHLEFGFVRPRSVRRAQMTVKPDLSKLVRAVEDSLTDAGVWRDDCLVVEAHTRKDYAERAGVLVRIETREGAEG